MSARGTPGPGAGPRRRSLQRRLAAIYGVAFLVMGFLMLVIPYGLARSAAVRVITLQPGLGPAGPQAVAAAQHGADLHRHLDSSLFALVVLVGLSAALAWLLAGRTLRPLREITSTTREITASNLHRRLAIDGPYDELRELGATFDDLLSRLEASFASQRNFVANASHELRTPLTAERALLQVALADPHASVDSLRAACEEVVALGEHQEQLIDDLLTLAESEQGLERLERFDLATIARSLVHDRSDEASRLGVRLEASCAPAPAVGDRRLVTILVGNLIDNAIRHNVPGGYATVRTSQSGRGSTVAVSNSGGLVDDEDVDRLCDPFTRLDETRRVHTDGHGLGLTIVRAVAETHGATLLVRARRTGGLAVDVTFPHRELAAHPGGDPDRS